MGQELEVIKLGKAVGGRYILAGDAADVCAVVTPCWEDQLLCSKSLQDAVLLTEEIRTVKTLMPQNR
jgi:hypothetical protein